MKRRRLLGTAAAWPLLAAGATVSSSPRRVRPGDPDWPDDSRWDALRDAVGGRLVRVTSPLVTCRDGSAADCEALFKRLRNPYYLGDDVGLTQTLGWVGAWTSMPSAYAVAASSAADVAAAVDFARQQRLRLVVRGGGHSYQGTSNAADSLLVWTRAMRAIELHDAFVPQGSAAAPVAAVTVGAGAMWGPVYDAVATQGGRYVQGGGCLTVGVAGLVQSGGFGSFSKGYGLAAASLLQAEVVTADGVVRTVNRDRDPELFWALKGGGGGSLGVVTQLTLRTHALPENVGAVNMTIAASSDAAWRRLAALVVEQVAERLHNPHWGEQITFRRGHVLVVATLFQGLDRGEASAVWQPFIDAVNAAPEDFHFSAPPFIVALAARRFWDPDYLRRFPGVVRNDDRPGAPPANIFWSGDQGQAAQVLHGYQSAWLPATLLQPARRAALADALVAASRHAQFSLHLNKGLAGAPEEALAASRDTAMNPAVLDAFALVIAAAEGPPAWPGIAGHEPDPAAARSHALAIDAAMDELRALVPAPGSYLAESDYFLVDWQRAYWGANRARLEAAKAHYDPGRLFDVHHGVGT